MSKMSDFLVSQKGDRARIWFKGALVAEIDLSHDAESVRLVVENKRMPSIEVGKAIRGDVEIFL